MRMTPEEFQAAQDRISASWSARVERARAIEPGKEIKVTKTAGKRNLYGAERVEIMGIKFDSKAEGKRYLQLKAMEQAGEISGLETQVCIALLPAQQVRGRKERPVNYFADFQYVRQGVLITEDVKSAPTKTKEFILKRKMAMFFHGIVVSEVMVD